MAGSKVNDEKRDRMAKEAEGAYARGWTVEQLAALFRVTPGTVNSWRRGNSMGLNSQRSGLANLGPPSQERERIDRNLRELRRVVERWEKSIAIHEAMPLNEDGTRGPHHQTDFHVRHAREQIRIATHRITALECIK